MAKNRYFLTTKGFNAEVTVAAPVAYTTQATYPLFVTNAVEGEIGFFNEPTNALIASTSSIGAPNTPAISTAASGGLITAGTYYYKVTALNGAGETVGSGEASITTSGTTSANTLSWNAVAGATSYRVYRGTAAGAEANYQATSSTNFVDASATGGTAGTVPVTSTALAPAPAISGTKMFLAQKRDGLIHKTAPFVFTAGIAVLTPYLAPVQDVWTISAFSAVANQQHIAIAIFETTMAAQPYQAWDFDVTIRGTEDLPTALGRLAAQINDPTNPININFGTIAAATVGGSGANSTLVLTAPVGVTIRIAVREDAQYTTVTHTTPFVAGIGTYDNVSEVEGEGIIFDGVTTNYPGSNAVPAEFGIPTLFASKSKTYNTYLFNFYESEQSPTPLERHWQKKFICLFTPVGGTTPDAAVKAILGL